MHYGAKNDKNTKTYNSVTMAVLTQSIAALILVASRLEVKCSTPSLEHPGKIKR